MNHELNLASEEQLFFHNYGRFDVKITKGDGVYLHASNGDQYLDMIAGIGVNAIGYGNERILDAITSQASKFIHLSNMYMIESQFKLAEKLLSLTGLSKVFFTNSGTEAIEAAIKLSRKWAHIHHKEKRQILSLSNCFHGRTYGAMTITDKPKYKEGYDPLVPDTDIVQFNDVADLEKKMSSKTAAIFLESIQGEGGIWQCSKEFIAKIVELQKKFDFLIVADEIQAGCGRTGMFFSYMNFNLQPDIVCAAKPLGGGLPLGAIIGSTKVADVFTKGVHGTTFGGNPVACAAGLAMIDEIIEKKLMEQSIRVGAYLKEKILTLKAKYTFIQEIRQYGLMIGISMSDDAKIYGDKLFENKIIVNVTNGNVVRLLPPLTITEKEVDMFISIFESIFEKIMSEKKNDT